MKNTNGKDRFLKEYGNDAAVFCSGYIMNRALQAAEELRAKGINVTLVDVSVPSDMQMWYGEKYQIKLGDSSRLAHKIESMQTVFLQQEYLEAGLVDVSFTDEERPNQVIFVPFLQ